MPLIQIPQTGKTVYISTYDYYFGLKEDDMDEFFRTCTADDLGVFTDNPFSDLRVIGKPEFEELPDFEEIIPPDAEKYPD